MGAVFIPKFGCSNYAEVESCRPISLTSFFLKAMERLVDNAVRKKLLGNMLLHPKKYAFQLGQLESGFCLNLRRDNNN